MRVFVRLFVVTVLLGGLFAGIYYVKQQQALRMAERQSAPPPPAAVAATRARVEEWRPAIRSVGSLVATNGVPVTTEVAGTVSEFGFESGQQVSAGDVLVRLEDSVDQAVLRGLVADRELARTQFQRASELLPQRAIPQSEFDEARFRYEGAQARVEEQRTRLAKKTIRAPFDGLLGLRLVDTGEYISPGDRIVELQALDPIYADYSVSEREFSNLFVGQEVALRVPAYPETEFSGTVSAIDSGIDEATRSVTVRATFANPDGALRPGMFTELRTLRPQTQSVVTVPGTAISFNTYGDYVFVVDEGEGGELSVRRRQVSTGGRRRGRVEIIAGLEAGDRVVRAGLVKLRDGQRIEIDDSVELDPTELSQQ